MGSRVDDSRGLGRFRLPDAARRAAAGWPWGTRANPAAGTTGHKAAKAALLLAAVFAAVFALAVVAAPALAQTSGGFPDYLLEEDGTVRIDGDVVMDCPTFATGLEQGYYESGDLSAGAQRVLEQCEEAGLLGSGVDTPSASASASAHASTSPQASAANGEDGGLPETGGPALPALLIFSGVLAMAGGLLARKVAAG